jgi:hypothetical protein
MHFERATCSNAVKENVITSRKTTVIAQNKQVSTPALMTLTSGVCNLANSIEPTILLQPSAGVHT